MNYKSEIVKHNPIHFTHDTDMKAVAKWVANPQNFKTYNYLEHFLTNFEALVEKEEVKFTLRADKLVMILPTNWNFTVEITVKE